MCMIRQGETNLGDRKVLSILGAVVGVHKAEILHVSGDGTAIKLDLKWKDLEAMEFFEGINVSAIIEASSWR